MKKSFQGNPKPIPSDLESEVVLKHLDGILHDEVEYRNLVSQEGELAQALLDVLQLLTTSPNTSPQLRSTILKAVLRLSRRSNLYPQCLTIRNVERLGEHAVASGGFGEIWKGGIEASQEVVCLKVVKLYQTSNVEKLLKNFMREAIVWRQLEHPNLLPFLGLFFLAKSKQQLCLISPWVENGNLIQFLERTPQTDVRHQHLVWDVANGLQHLHQMKIIHADLKGANVLITKAGRAVVADFGLSYVAEGEVLMMTSSSAFLGGTPRWLAPELLNHLTGPSYESDIYAFGCVCYEIYTGLRPFYELRVDAAVILEVVNGKRPSRPAHVCELDDDIWALMNQCWVADPSSRPDIDILGNRLHSLFGPIDSSPPWDLKISKHIWLNVQEADVPSNSRQAFAFLSQSHERLQTRRSWGGTLRGPPNCEPIAGDTPTRRYRPLPPTPGEAQRQQLLAHPRKENPGSGSVSPPSHSHPVHTSSAEDLDESASYDPVDSLFHPQPPAPQLPYENLFPDDSPAANQPIAPPQQPALGVSRALDPSLPHSHHGNGHDHPSASGDAVPTPAHPGIGVEQRYGSVSSLLTQETFDASSTTVHGPPGTISERSIKKKDGGGGWFRSWNLDRNKEKDHSHRDRGHGSWQLVGGKDEETQGELTKNIGYLNATGQEDWALVLDVCECASSSEIQAKEAVLALRREFKYGEPSAQLGAARLWAIMLRNSNEVFIAQSTSRKFLETLEVLLTGSETSPVVRERVLGILAAAAYASPSSLLFDLPFTEKDTGFRGLWKKVKPHDKPDEGVPFDTDDAMFNPPVMAPGNRSSMVYNQSLPDPGPGYDIPTSNTSPKIPANGNTSGNNAQVPQDILSTAAGVTGTKDKRDKSGRDRERDKDRE
ncbi:Rho guanine nucleotide exchange factor [Paramarasmius palmivorus]|uniref:Rho guanine nucleotide exchange factor n=1 Tax=Paramarasmius palmivorus TaxID=297713 RepID=A0AAW0DFS9_9AGAR